MSRQEALDGFARLEQLSARRPGQLIPDLLLGLLAYGVGRDGYGVLKMAIVASAQGSPRAWFLGAVMAARMGDPSERNEAFALHALAQGLRAGLDPRLAEAEPALQSLRKRAAYRALFPR